MKAVFVKGHSAVSVDEIKAPEMASEGDVLVRMRACGLCGSDLEKVYGEYGMSSGRLGHEPAGEVVAVGKNAKGFAPGDRVFIHHHVPCYSCHYCLHGDYTMCPEYQKSNIAPCGLAEQFIVPEWNVSRGGLIKLPAGMTFDEASLVEPLACCIRAWNKCNFQRGDDIAVLGAGPAGLMHVILAKAFGAGRVFVSDINDFRLDFARKKYGVETFNSISTPDFAQKIKEQTGGRGVDIAVVATGSTKALLQSFDMTRRAGKIMLFGVPSKGSAVSYDMSKLYSNEHSLIPSYAASEVETNQAIKLIAEKRIEIASLITHRFDISDASEAIKCAHEAKDAMKVIVTTGNNI
ncbi:theronine dehydrogenase-like Zn-dependent dehydrogenase [Candidatus Nitrososphaera evergladensis SR1]|jgi:L-iditol 2-dehydrogenase|uniref:Theronine dehydrogenase-like Zn-dependent dehydrogenase n=1 Tax=Candidatus Nitrososphaera evergladensis SR1 TaxID=1459636 RepID=A0A075MSV4_9ARCH|nr:zinc-dependent dehydrogenase [Candidatus Nitrososphaera evergladensis]AIF84235.1 theronine dehydrogenase-like Zn-dependent dehydrogenase [Candidatus Nitrososphaera evergladensis SR1]